MDQDGVRLNREQFAAVERALRLSVEGNVDDTADTPEAALDANIDAILDAQEAGWAALTAAAAEQGIDLTRPPTTDDRADDATPPTSPPASRQQFGQHRSQR